MSMLLLFQGNAYLCGKIEQVLSLHAMTCFILDTC